jgi:plasmid stabilization system protein ParE
VNVRKTDEFIADVERQFEWYAVQAGWEIAAGYLRAVEATCVLLARHPRLGPLGHFSDPRLCKWRFSLVFRPFQKNLVFYELAGDDIIMRRATHGSRDLPRRLLQPPEIS